MALPKLAERVSLILPDADAVSRVRHIEEQLASHGLPVVSLESSVSSFFSDVSLVITGMTTASNGYAAGIQVDLEGKVCLIDGQIKPTVEFSRLERIAVSLIYRGEHIVTFLAGAESPYKLSPECQTIAKHQRWRNYGEAGTVNFLIIPEDGRHVPPKRHVDKAYSLEEASRLASVDTRVRTIHKIVGDKFFYCMVQFDGEGQRKHYLTLDPTSNGDRFKNGVDALCRIIDTYPSMMDKMPKQRQLAEAV